MQAFEKIHEKFIAAAGFFSVFAPVFAVLLPHVFIAEQSSEIILVALSCMVFSILNCFWYYIKKDTQNVLTVFCAIYVVCFSAALFVYGGLNSSLLIFGPAITVICGALKGYKGGLWSTFFIVGVLILIYLTEGSDYKAPATSSLLMLTQAIVSLVSVAFFA